MHRYAMIAAGLSVAGLAGAASAADRPLKAPAATAAPVRFFWTGCYVGGHAGGGVSEDRTTNFFGNSLSYNSSGFVGGGQIGCDYQFAAGWVAGVEGRAAWSSLRNSRAESVRNLITGVILPSQFSLSNDFLASATARLGRSFADRWLLFVRGGAAWTQEKADDAFTNVTGITVDPSAAMTRSGWTAGTGVDWAFAPRWSATLEYDYYDFGNRGATLTNSSTGTVVTLFGLKDTIHAATAGVNYRF